MGRDYRLGSRGWLPASARAGAFVLAISGVPMPAGAADFAFIASEHPFAVAYAPESVPAGPDLRPVIVRNVGTMALDIRLGIGERPSAEVFAIVLAGAAASFVTGRSLFVSCPLPNCRSPVEINYFPAE